jgi:hypothetical protein
MLKCLIHELPSNIVINNFYARLTLHDKDLLDASCSGSFTRMKEEAKWDLIDRIQENIEGWENNKGRKSGINYDYECIKAFMETDDFHNVSVVYGLDSQILANCFKAFASYFDVPKKDWNKYHAEGFRSIGNKKIPTKTNKNKPRSDLRDAKQRAREIRSTYPCRLHSGNVQMNVVGVVVLASPPRDPTRSKRHNGWRLRALHTYSTTMTPPPRSNKVRWSDRWDQQHNGMVLMVESICGQGFAYAHEVEEDWAKELVKLGLEATGKRDTATAADQISPTLDVSFL